MTSKSLQQYPTHKKKKVSGEVTWELMCRTDSDGILVVPSAKKYEDQVVMSNLTSWKKGATRPVTFPIGRDVRFNLFWSRAWEPVSEAYGGGAWEEAQLDRCWALVEDDDAQTLGAIYVKALGLKADDPAQLLQWVKQHWCHNSGDTSRSLINLSAWQETPKGGTSRIHAKPHLRLRDEDLRWALKLSDRIADAAEAPLKKDVYGDLAKIERALKILEEYEKQKATGAGDLFNNVRDKHLSYEKTGSNYSNARGKIEGQIADASRHIEDCGKLLVPLVPGALLQARAHYSTDTAARYADRVLGGVGVYLARNLWDDFLGSAGDYAIQLKRVEDAKAKAKPPESASEQVGWLLGQVYSLYKDDLKVARKVNGLAKKTNADALRGVTQWIQLSLAAQFRQPPAKLAEGLNRANHWLSVLEDPLHLNSKVTTVVSATGGQTVHIDLRGVELADKQGIKQLTLVMRLKKVGALVGKLDTVFKYLNFAIAMIEVMNHPDVKRAMKAAKSAAQVADLLQKAYSSCKEAAKITSESLTKFAGAVTAVVGVMDALDKFGQGNNTAALGHMLEASGGVIAVLCRGGTAGWIAAGLTLVGVMVVYWSLEEDEKFLVGFDSTFWRSTRHGPNFSFLRKGDLLLSHANLYVSDRTS